MKRIEILHLDGSVANIILCDEDWAEQYHPGCWRIAPETELPASTAPRHISVGAFYDRFGAAKWGILADESAAVRAVVRDASIRQYIDLDNSQLSAGLAKLVDAGHQIDPAAIISAPVQLHELP